MKQKPLIATALPPLILLFTLLPATTVAQSYDFTYRKGRKPCNPPSVSVAASIAPKDVKKPQIIRGKDIPPQTQTARLRVELPPHNGGIFFSRDYRDNTDHVYPNNTNRLLPWRFSSVTDVLHNRASIPSIPQPAEQGEALLLKLKNGAYLLLKAVAGDNSLSWMTPEEDGTLTVFISTMGPDFLPSEVPAIVAAQSRNLHQAFSDAAHIALQPQALRERKPFFEAFRYLGWCTWEHYFADIDEAKISADIRAINASPIPVRYILIDDGHLRFSQNQLTGIDPDPLKFPHGWTPIMQARNPEKIKWMGLWLCFSGYWDGISPQNNLPQTISKNLYRHNRALLPGKSYTQTLDYYTRYLQSVRQHGFDFVKMDNQSFILPLYMGGERTIERARNCNIALEKAAHSLGLGLINCMAQNTLNIDNTLHSNLSRVSIDYKKFNLDMARSHIWQSYVNTLIQGQSVFPDHDMFHSSDTVAGALMARSKAISGGAVYLSDAPADFVPEVILPLVDEDGGIFRPQAPAVPFPDFMDGDPFAGGKAFRVFAPTGSEAMSIICYNLGRENRKVSYKISANDYAHRNAMLPGKKSREYADFVLFDQTAGTLALLSRGQRPAEGELTGFSDRLFHLIPIIDGWAVVGLKEKYISPETVEIVFRSKQCLQLKPRDKGTLVVARYENGHLSVKNITVENKDNPVHIQATHF